MSSTTRRPPRRRPPPRRRGGGGVALVVLLVVLGALFYLLFGGGFERLASAPAEPSPAPVEDPVDVTFDELLDRAEDNDDGTVTLRISEAETGGLVRRGLSRGGAPALDDVTVDLQRPDGSAPGQMVLTGRLPDQNLPVTATVDLEVRGGAIEPTVRDARVGPVAVPAGVREDLNRQLQDVSLLAEQGVQVTDLRTTERRLVVTGRRG